MFNQLNKLDSYFVETNNRGIEQWFQVELVSALRQMGYHEFRWTRRQHDLTFNSPGEPEEVYRMELKAGSYRGDAAGYFRQLIEGASKYPGVDCLFLARVEEGWERNHVEAALDGVQVRLNGRCRIVFLEKVADADAWWIGHLTRDTDANANRPGTSPSGPTSSA